MTDFLDKKNLQQNPLLQFELWFEEAVKKNIYLPEAFCLSTVTETGRPDSRMLLLKGVEGNGFVFYTNLNSAKGRQLHQSPYASMTWYWGLLGRQVRVAGMAQPVSVLMADQYFASRPRDSQLGAWASHQSKLLASRDDLEKQFLFYQHKFKDQIVPRPEHWSGFCLVPDRIEFWQERPNRLHDRFQYTLKNEVWEISRLSP